MKDIVERHHGEEAAKLVAAINEYANPLNWAEDDNYIRRVWVEPGSSTPEAYNGFELARAAITKHDTSTTTTKEEQK